MQDRRKEKKPCMTIVCTYISMYLYGLFVIATVCLRDTFYQIYIDSMHRLMCKITISGIYIYTDCTYGMILEQKTVWPWLYRPAQAISMLETLLGELNKHILKLPKWFFISPTMIAMGWPTARAISLIRKLSFLLTAGDVSTLHSLSAQTLTALSDNVVQESSCLVRECRE